jgi:hypothetical protein
MAAQGVGRVMNEENPSRRLSPALHRTPTAAIILVTCKGYGGAVGPGEP